MNKLILLLPLAFAHAQTFAGAAPPHASAARRIPDAPLSRPQAPATAPSVQTRVIPRILSGGDWQTAIVLVNTGTAPVEFQQFFFDADGRPAAYEVRAGDASQALTASAIQGALAAGTSLKTLLSAAGDVARDGWSLLTYNTGSGAVDGYAIIARKGLNGAPASEITVPLSRMQDYSAYVPFDNALGFRTRLTLVNPAGNLPSQVRLTYLNPAGKALLIDSVTLHPGQQMTLALPDSYPDLANKTGGVLVDADTDRLAVMALRSNEAYGAIAALPVMIRNAALPE